MRRNWLVILSVLSLSVRVEALFNVTALNDVIANSFNANAFDCSVFQNSCAVLNNVITNSSGDSLSQDFALGSDVMQEFINEYAGASMWQLPIPNTAITFGDSNYPAFVQINNSSSGSNIVVDAIDSVALVAAGTSNISVFADSTIPAFTYDAVNPSNVTFASDATSDDGVVIRGDVVIYGALELADASTKLTIDGNLYVFAGGNNYVELQGGTLHVTGNAYFDGKNSYAITLAGTLTVAGDMYLHNHLAQSSAAVLVNDATIDCGGMILFVNNSGQATYDAVRIFESEVTAATAMAFHRNAALGTGNGVSVVPGSSSTTLTVTVGAIDFIANSSVGASSNGVFIDNTVTITASTVNFVGNQGLTSAAYGVLVAGTPFGGSLVYSVNNTSTSGVGFRYNGQNIYTQGFDNTETSSYTGPVPFTPYGGSILTGAKTNADIPGSGDMVINPGTLTLTDDATINGNLVIVASASNYLDLQGHTLTVSGDIILDGASTYSLTIDGSLITVAGHATIQNNFSSSITPLPAVNVASTAVIGGTSDDPSLSVSIVGNRSSTIGKAQTVSLAGTVSNNMVYNFAGNSLATTADKPRDTSLLYYTGSITALQSVNFVGNSSAAGVGIWIDGDAIQGGTINFNGNTLNYTGSEVVIEDDPAFITVWISNGTVSAQSGQNINIIGNSTVVTGSAAIAVSISVLQSGDTALVTGDSINILGNSAQVTSEEGEGLVAVCVAMSKIDDVEPDDVAAMTMQGQNLVNIVGNVASGTSDASTYAVGLGILFGEIIAPGLSFTVQTINGNSAINVIGNQADSGSVVVSTNAIIQNGGNPGLINFIANSADIAVGQVGVNLQNNASVSAPTGLISFLANSAYTSGINSNLSTSLSAVCVDAYSKDFNEFPFFYNGAGQGSCNGTYNACVYTGLIPPPVG